MTAVTWLYHGSPASNAAAIRAEGVEGPSYWGSLADAREYAGPGGLVVRVDPDWDPGIAVFDVNVGLLQAALDEGELTSAEAPTDWRTSVEVLGSARCQDRVPASWLEEMPPAPRRRPSP